MWDGLRGSSYFPFLCQYSHFLSLFPFSQKKLLFPSPSMVLAANVVLRSTEADSVIEFVDTLSELISWSDSITSSMPALARSRPLIGTINYDIRGSFVCLGFLIKI